MLDARHPLRCLLFLTRQSVLKVWRFPAAVACVGGADHLLSVACVDGSIWTWTAAESGGRSKRQRVEHEPRLPAVIAVCDEASLTCALSASDRHVALFVSPAGPDSHDCL
jgi:hypothetical protein